MRTIGGHQYIEFVMPGVLMMNIITAAFLQSSSAIYFSRFIRFMEEMLVAPLSYLEMIVGSLATVVVRATVTGIGILAIGPRFGATTIAILAAVPVLDRGGFDHLRPGRHLIGLWSKSFEQLNMPVVFLPHAAVHAGRQFQHHEDAARLAAMAAWANPFFYFINGIRGAMIGFDEAPRAVWESASRSLIAVVLGGWWFGGSVRRGLWPARVGSLARWASCPGGVTASALPFTLWPSNLKRLIRAEKMGLERMRYRGPVALALIDLTAAAVADAKSA